MKVLITGGAGFIGINAAKRFLDRGYKVVIFDNLSRNGSKKNLDWLRKQSTFEFIKGDVRDYGQIKQSFHKNKHIDVVLHLAAQVAVTSSVIDPRTDFEINALGTFNVCEAIRQLSPHSILLNASTNKVYGEIASPLKEEAGKYVYKNRASGIPENEPLDFHSPYGCSKGAADQYAIDYARIYGLKTVTFRQSCIYGTRQFGVEDQGWVAWFTICAVLGKPFTIYGDGKQARDILFVDDLIDCYLKAIKAIDRIKGQVYNIGGGPKNILSLLELVEILEQFLGKKLLYNFDNWRPGDQKVFICDIRNAFKDFKWKPAIAKENGVKKLFEWIGNNRDLFK